MFKSQYTIWFVAYLVCVCQQNTLSMAIPVAGQLYSYLKNHKAPLNIVGINGLVPHKYSLVYTTISIKPEDYGHTAQKLGPSPIITRAQIGSVGPEQPASQFQVQLDVPDTQIDLLKSTHNIPELVTKIAGAVNPLAGAVSGAVSAVLDIGLQMASDQINTALGIQETSLGLVEILPTKYYRINSNTNEIELTPDFKTDLVAYDALHARAVPAIQAFSAANEQYELQRMAYYKKYGTYDVIEDDQASQTDYNALTELYTNQLVPLLKTAVTNLKQLETFSLHRISIMALNTKPGDSCGNDWKGPFRLCVFFFLGAKATNTFNLDFCVKNSGTIQNVLIKLSPDILSTNPLRWNKGGIRFVAVDQHNQPCTQSYQIGFQTLRAGQPIMATESALLSWWDSMVVSGDDRTKGLTQYLFPFDLLKLQKEVQAKNQTQESSLLQAAGSALGTLATFFGKKETEQKLLDPTTTCTRTSASNSAGDMFSVLSSISPSASNQETSQASANSSRPDQNSSTVINPHEIPAL